LAWRRTSTTRLGRLRITLQTAEIYPPVLHQLQKRLADAIKAKTPHKG